MKKILSLALVVVLMLGCVAMFASCGKDEDEFKIGLICLHDEKSTYDLNFINGMKEVQAALGLKDSQVIIKVNVPESNECYEAAADMVDQGCKIVFADSFGHEEFMIKAAKEFPNVQFCHATGVMAVSDDTPANYHNAFASIYEGRYLAGVAAGLKLNELKAAGKLKGEVPKMGYVGAFTYAEVVSGYTSFYLGAKSVCPDVVMDVKFSGSWYDATEERSIALSLINSGCDLISQHADSMGAPGACEENGIPNVSYNGSTLADCPNTFIVSSRINWAPYFKYIIDAVQNNKTIATDWCGTMETESVQLTDVNTAAAAAGTVEKLAEVRAALAAGTTHVFDTANFTVGGSAVTTYTVEGVEVVKNGYFAESDVNLLRSAPYFDLRIDGITLLNEKY